MIRRISVRGIVLHDGTLLSVKLKPYKGSLGVSKDGWWCTPGGGLDEGESLLDGIRREMVEETGVPPAVGNLLYVQQFSYGEKDYLEFFFHIINAKDYLQIGLAQTTHGIAEIETIEFVDPKTTPLLPKFLTAEDLARHAAKPGPPKFFSYYG